jgi:hypothetical protein
VSQKESLVKIPEKLDTLFDKLYYSYFSDEVDAMLTEAERVYRSRVDEAWHHMVGRKSSISAADFLQSQHGVSRATAYRIVRDALQLFGDVVKTSKDAMRRLLWEYSLKGLDECLAQGDLRAYAAILKNMTTFQGLNLEDNSFDGEAIQAHTYLIQIGTGGPGGGELRFNANAVDELPADQYELVQDAVENMTISPEQMDELLDKAERKGKKK